MTTLFGISDCLHCKVTLNRCLVASVNSQRSKTTTYYQCPERMAHKRVGIKARMKEK
jgi:hypothetical protein